MSSALKREFVVTYDYGMGDLWLIIMAQSPEDIEKKYPFLDVQNKTVSDFPPEQQNVMRKKFFFDIDEPLTGLLKDLVEENSKGKKQSFT